MIQYQIRILLLSETTFGRGDGVAGIIDREVEQDADGIPYLRGRTLKGLLCEEADNLIATISNKLVQEQWLAVADRLFGQPGSTLGTQSLMHVGDACLPEDFRQAISAAVKLDQITQTEVINSLTTVRRQTAIDENDENLGIAAEGSLRSFRVILREQKFSANLLFHQEPTLGMLTLLQVSTLALRRTGSSRNRGLGHVQCRLLQNNQDITESHVNLFGQEIPS
jgi:CRISPR/Cas system CSM-associated protein Csm3 (group 7 of RAMP superfamily)